MSTTADRLLRHAGIVLVLTTVAASGVETAASANVSASNAGGAITLTAVAAPTYHLVDADRANDGGVFLRNSPRWADTSRTPGFGLYYGESGELICGTWGDAVGPYSNRRWHKVRDLSRSVGIGWLPDRYFDTPNNANQPTPGERECGPADIGGAVLTSAPTRPTVINGANVGYAQNGVHQWGGCRVQDFKGGPLDWVIVSYTNGTHIVHGGMLFGWFDNGGAPGIGCPVNQEHPYLNGVRQDFTSASLYWFPGMNHAARITDNRIEKALADAFSHNQTPYKQNLCLEFVATSFSNTGWHLKGPYGINVRAVDWWNTDMSPAPRHPGDMHPPRGALVYWDFWHGGDGHTAISLGNGLAISTSFNGNPNVHVFTISDVPQHYRGWREPV